MKKHQVLYDWLIERINALADSSDAETFALNLSSARQIEFANLTEKLRQQGAKLAAAKASRQHYAGWEELWANVTKFCEDFASFADLKPIKIKLAILLASKLAQDGATLDTRNVNDQLFELRDLQFVPPLLWFVRENARSFADSIVVLACADITELGEKILGSNISPDLAFHLLATLRNFPDVSDAHIALVKRETPSIAQEAVNAFARLALVANGKVIHIAPPYGRDPSLIDKDILTAGVPYQQFNDVLDVLSEYNSRPELLTKFLTLYHVVENFIFKLPIVRLERQKGGDMFSIRDFRRMYDNVSDHESVAINKAVATLLRWEYSPGRLIKSRVTANWDALLPSGSPAQVGLNIQKALGALGLMQSGSPMTHRQFKTGDIATNLAQMIYTFRNAIVHNKATEFHLTYATLTNDFSMLLEHFLLPTLEEICFHLIGARNDYVWYSHESLLLYK